MTSVDGIYARVMVPKKSTCEGCTAGTCTMGEQSMEIEAVNRAGAAAGQRVRVLVHTAAYLKGSLIIYGLPTLFLVIGAVFGKEFMPRFFPDRDSDILSAIFGFGFLIASFILVRLWSQQQVKKTDSVPVVEEILD